MTIPEVDPWTIDALPVECSACKRVRWFSWHYDTQDVLPDCCGARLVYGSGDSKPYLWRCAYHKAIKESLAQSVINAIKATLE